MKQQLVMIEWFDSAMHGTDQRSREEAMTECGIVEGVSAGLLVYEDKYQVTLALDWFYQEDQFRQIATYPKKCIRKITRRTVKKQRLFDPSR